jgi:hypothetical protein
MPGELVRISDGCGPAADGRSFTPRSASCARNAATASGVAGIDRASPCSQHHASNRSASLLKARTVDPALSARWYARTFSRASRANLGRLAASATSSSCTPSTAMSETSEKDPYRKLRTGECRCESLAGGVVERRSPPSGAAGRRGPHEWPVAEALGRARTALPVQKCYQLVRRVVFEFDQLQLVKHSRSPGVDVEHSPTHPIRSQVVQIRTPTELLRPSGRIRSCWGGVPPAFADGFRPMNARPKARPPRAQYRSRRAAYISTRFGRVTICFEPQDEHLRRKPTFGTANSSGSPSTFTVAA